VCVINSSYKAESLKIISYFRFSAGTMAPYTLTKDGFESAFAINYLGHFLLTHLLMPRLIAAGTNDKAARIVNVSSSGQALGFFQINDLQGE
jgi:dehydrogenase/reductase SDR family protein X